jgi:hypothetical protein
MLCQAQMSEPTIALNCHNDKKAIYEKSSFIRLTKVVKKTSLIQKQTVIKTNQSLVLSNRISSFQPLNFIKMQSENVVCQ